MTLNEKKFEQNFVNVKNQSSEVSSKKSLAENSCRIPNFLSLPTIFLSIWLKGTEFLIGDLSHHEFEIEIKTFLMLKINLPFVKWKIF